jgi:adenosylhomocysteine nucleosidase
VASRSSWLADASPRLTARPHSLNVERLHDLKIEAAYISDWRALVATGGHGKTQFAVQAQYLIDQFSSVELVICAGATGSLAPELSVGDVVVGTETVEHDYRQLFTTRPLPRFSGHGPSIDALRRSAQGVGGFRVAFDVIASGDEDVVTSERAQAIRERTGAACVAWEGSGAARAALFNGIGSLEIRAVTDAADKEAPQRFEVNLPIAMANLASLLGLCLGRGETVSVLSGKKSWIDRGLRRYSSSHCGFGTGDLLCAVTKRSEDLVGFGVRRSTKERIDVFPDDLSVSGDFEKASEGSFVD